jgi:hypothetical protein
MLGLELAIRSMQPFGFEQTPGRGEMAREQGRQPPDSPGVISVWEVYTLEEARQRLRWTESAARSARRQGLKLMRCGKRRYVTGKEIVRFLKQINGGS